VTEGPDPTNIDLDLVRRFLRNRDRDIERLARLEDATTRLSDEVHALTGAVTTYATQGQIHDIEEILTEHEGQFESRAKALITLRLRIRRRTNVMFAITCVLLLVTSAFLWYYVVHNTNDRRAACRDRNHEVVMQSQQTRDFFTPKLAQEQANPHADPVLVSILRALVASKPTLVACGG
jgi:hypothetical protein